MLFKLKFVVVLLMFSVSSAVIHPFYSYAKEWTLNRIEQLEDQITELNQLLELLIQMNAPQYMIDEVQSRIDESTAELNYLLNIEFLEE